MQSIHALLPKLTAQRPASIPPHLTPTKGGATPAGEQPRPVLPDSPDLVELTEAEVEKVTKLAVARAIRQAKEDRWQELKTARYWWDVSHPEEAARLNLNELKQHFMAAARQHISPDFKTDHGLGEVLHKLACYFADHEDFDKLGAGYSRQKGLLLVGTVGVGKSSLMRVWGQLNQRQRFGVKSCSAVADAFTAEGAEGLEVWKQPRPSGVCFDDLGTESLTTKNYGNEVSPMASVLLARYELFQSGRITGGHTHITTNLPWKDLSMYGDRVTDRIKEMFNIIAFPPSAPSRRQ